VQQVQLAKRRRSCGARGYKRKFNVSLVFLSFDQSYYLAPLYSIKRMYNVAPIEHGKQTFHRSLRVPAVFPQDAPGVLNGANDGILVGIVHDRYATPRKRNQDWRQIFVPVWRCGFMSRRLSRPVARSVHSRVGLVKPARLGPATP